MSLICFKLIFMSSIRYESSFIFLQVIVQLSQHFVLNRLSLLQISILSDILGSLVKYWLSILLRVVSCVSILSCWSICLFLLVTYCFDYCGFIVQLEVRKRDASCFVLPSQDYFGSSGYSVVSNKF